MACTDCTKLSPITKGTAGCKASKPKIGSVRLACCENLVETIVPSPNADCPTGYINNLVSVDPILLPEPMVSVEIFNKDDIDETNTFTFDRATDIGEDTYAIQFGIKVLNPDHDCVFQSLKGQDICLYYQIENQSGEYVWRRVKGKVTAVEGGLLAGYLITLDNVDPSDADRPLYINFSTAAATTAAIDLLTQF